MNPAAQAFVPKKKSRDNSSPTQLSAAAAPFVPPSKTEVKPPQEPVPPLPAGVMPTQHADPEAQATTADASPATAGAGAVPELDTPPNSIELLEQQLAEVPPATPLDWSESKLPALFGCHNTKAKATTDPIRLHTTWDLYADDHGNTGSPLVNGPAGAGAGTGAGTTPYDPQLVSTVGDVETYWRLWRHLPPPSSCPVPFTYSWFRSDIRPEWEHPRNKRGGIITIVVFDRDRPGLNDKQVLDDVWMATLTGCAGESFAETANTLNGVMIKIRPNNRPVTMQLWTAHSEPAKLRAFANSFRDAIGKVMGSKWLQKLEYFSHNHRQAAQSSLAARMQVKPKISPDHVF